MVKKCQASTLWTPAAFSSGLQDDCFRSQREPCLGGSWVIARNNFSIAVTSIR